MNWKSRNRHLILAASGQFEWMQSHTQVPCVLVLDDRLRVYFATRPASGMSLVGCVDLDFADPRRTLHLYDAPVLGHGRPGMFDEHGVIPNHVFRHGSNIYLLYVGWSRRETVPYSNWMGLAVSEDNGRTFRRMFDGPILDRTPDEVYSATGLTCIRHDGKWRGWYATGSQWLLINGRHEHTYELRECESEDLIHWSRPNKPLFPAKLPNESSTRPSVIFARGIWHMWFCYRGTQDFRDGADGYRVGYAFSTDLRHWTRDDGKAGIRLSSEGWDSKMIAYPCVVHLGDRFLMFYSGNYFGRAGFGFAELEAQDGGI